MENPMFKWMMTGGSPISGSHHLLIELTQPHVVWDDLDGRCIQWLRSLVSGIIQGGLTSQASVIRYVLYIYNMNIQIYMNIYIYIVLLLLLFISIFINVTLLFIIYYYCYYYYY